MFHAQLNVGHKWLYAKVTMIDDFGVIVQCFNYIAFGFLFLGIVEVFLCIIFLLVRNQTGYLGIPFYIIIHSTCEIVCKVTLEKRKFNQMDRRIRIIYHELPKNTVFLQWEVLFTQGFKHLVDAAFLLLHIRMNIEI